MQLAGGVLLAHVGLGGLQALLGQALGGQLAIEADDTGGLAGAARLELLQALGGQGGAPLLGLVALVLAPEQQGQRA